MTMVEMLVAVGIGSLVTIALASLIIYTARGFDPSPTMWTWTNNLATPSM